MSEIDVLMDKLRNAEHLTMTDVDKIIEDQIRRLQLYNSGTKPKKASTEKIDTSEQMKKILSTLVPDKPKSTFKRRV